MKSSKACYFWKAAQWITVFVNYNCCLLWCIWPSVPDNHTHMYCDFLILNPFYSPWHLCTDNTAVVLFITLLLFQVVQPFCLLLLFCNSHRPLLNFYFSRFPKFAPGWPNDPSAVLLDVPDGFCFRLEVLQAVQWQPAVLCSRPDH